MALSEGDRHDAYLRRVQPPDLEMDGILTAVRHRATFIAGVALACVALSLVYVLLAIPRYAASGRIELGPSAAADAASQIRDLTSPRVFNNVIEREKLDGDPLFGARPRGPLAELLTGIGLVPAADSHMLALRQLERAVSVTPEPNSSIVNVNAVTSDRETSARVANAMMDAYLEDAARLRTGTAPSAGTPFDQSLELLQGRVRDAEQRYQKYRQDNGIAGSNSQPEIEKQVGELSSQLTAAEARAADLRSTLSQLQRARNSGDLEAVPPALRTRTIDALRSRYANARRIEADLSETLGPRHPDLKFARQQLAEARQKLDREIGDIAQSAAGDLERAKSEVTRLRGRLEAAKKSLASSNGIAVHLRDLERDIETSRADVQAFLLKSKSPAEQQQQQVQDSFPRILSRATPPLEREGGSPVRVLFISVLLGLGLAVSLAWLLELVRGKGEGMRFNR